MDTTAGARWNVYDKQCPTRQTLDRIADKWTVLIVGRLATRKRRFGELRREIAGISPKMLTHKLRELERDGLITRRIYASVPPKVEYRHAIGPDPDWPPGRDPRLVRDAHRSGGGGATNLRQPRYRSRR